MTDFSELFGDMGDKNPKARAIELPGGLGALLVGALMQRLGGEDAGGDHADHALLKRLGATPPVPFRAATKEQFLRFFDGWEKFKIGDIVEIRKGYAIDRWPQEGERAIVTQVLDVPVHCGNDFSESFARANDVALLFVQNIDPEVAEAMNDKEDMSALFEFLYDSRRLVKVGTVFDSGY